MSTVKKHDKERGNYTEDRQRRDLRRELKEIIDYAFDNWEDMEKVAESAGRGYAASSPDGAGGSGESTVVEMAAFHKDPGEEAKEWFAEMAEFVGRARSIERKARAVLPLTEKERKRAGERRTTVEQCAHCNDPIIDGQVKRIDNRPHHANTCYFTVWRAKRKEAG